MRRALTQSSNYQESKSAHSYSYSYSSEMSSAMVSGDQQAGKDKDHCTLTLRFNEACKAKEMEDCAKVTDHDPTAAAMGCLGQLSGCPISN
ncbi:MAG: hypothetical protein K0S08_1020 [Gammaproteobacteria bacterium]|jgi:hypothetical protein|nr:hypothetical protein [Gammaproteobacteria bacterium]